MLYQLSDEKRDILNFFYTILIFVVICSFGLGFWYLHINQKKFDLSAEVDVADLPISSPTSILTSNIVDKESYILKVINSSGERGLASKTVEEIKKAGFVVESSVGNGDQREGSKIFIKSDSYKSSKFGIYLQNKFSVAVMETSDQVEDFVIDLGK